MALNAFVKAKMKKKLSDEDAKPDTGDTADTEDTGDTADTGDTDTAEKPTFPPKKGVNPFAKGAAAPGKGAPAAKGAGNPLMAWMKSKGKK